MVLKCGILRLDKHREILKLEGPLDHKQSFGLRQPVHIIVSLSLRSCTMHELRNQNISK